MNRILSQTSGVALAATLFAGALTASVSAHELVGKSRAAIVHEADLVGVFDLGALQSSPMLQRLEAEANENQTPEAIRNRELWERLTGLGRDNLVSLWFSVDFGPMSTETMAQPPSFEEVDALMAIQVAKPLEFETLRDVVQSSAEGRTSFTDSHIGDTPVIVVANKDPEKPSLLTALSADGKTIFLSVRPQSLEDGLARAASNDYVALPENLETTLSSDSHHARISFVAPAELRTAISDQLAQAEADPEAAMTSGFLAPFQGLRSLSMALSFTQDLELDLVSDLGDPNAATQALGMFQMMLPMVKASLAEKSGREPASYNEMISAGAEGPELELRFRLTEEELKALRDQNKKEEKTAGAPQR